MKLICEHCGNAEEFIIDRAVTYVCVYGSDGKVLRVNNGPMEVGDIQCAKCFNTTVADTEQRFTTAINKDVTLFLGAIATGATTAEFVLFTPCCGLSKQFNNNVVFITA